MFSTTTVKPALGVTLTFTADTELLLQDTGRVFGLADEGERERAGSASGLRILMEVVKSRSSVSFAGFHLTRAAFGSLGSRRNRECSPFTL
jgi:DNA repair protein RAD51